MFKVTRSDFQGGNFFQNPWLSDACCQASSHHRDQPNFLCKVLYVTLFSFFCCLNVPLDAF
jgi:hypothetical protein